MVLYLNRKESKVFYEFIDAEIHCCVNEYDYDTGRCPSKKRLADSRYAKSVIEKWAAKQDKVDGNFINLDKIISCDIELSEKEARYCKVLIDKAVKDIGKELSKLEEPYTGANKIMKDMADTAVSITKSLTI